MISAIRSTSFKMLAWRHLLADWESSAGVAVALLLIPLPGALLIVDAASARSDLQAVVARSGGVTLQRAGVASATAYDTFQQQAQSQVAGRLGQYLNNGDERGQCVSSQVNHNHNGDAHQEANGVKDADERKAASPSTSPGTHQDHGQGNGGGSVGAPGQGGAGHGPGDHGHPPSPHPPSPHP